MHLLIGSSVDATADVIVAALGSRILRLNNDRAHDHRIVVKSDGFSVCDDYGRRVDSSSLLTVVLRKMERPMHAKTGEEMYAIREQTRALEALLDWIQRFKPEAMPMSHRAMDKATKFVCASVAQSHFSVPEWAFTSTPSAVRMSRPVLKNLSGMPVEEAGPDGAGKMLYVQEVGLDELAEGWPWFLQEKVESRYDLTVLYLGGECHALRLDRSKFEGLDWRKFIGAGVDEQWELVALPSDVSGRIDAFMRDMDLSYGRLDFLYSREDFGDLQFLEVNPHGQWAWMDLKKDRGIFDAMMRFLTTPKTIRR